ncbi:MAG TPA: hypothetical protein VHX42_04320 [Candidatus Babeliales bacterium]|jgi:hypothetical protein|nr:hypothetical protein [Candidatus Babeliales bacterium]
MTKKTVPMSEIYGLLLFIVYIVYVLVNFKQGNMTLKQASWEGYRNWLVLSTFISFIIIAIELYRGKVIDRLIWAATLFFLIGTIGCLGNISFITDYYDVYFSAILLMLLCIVGIVTTCFSPAGFVGVLSENKKKVWHASLTLLAVNIICVVWSVWAQCYGLTGFFYFVFPVVAWRSIRDILVKKIHGEKIGFFID